VFLNSLPQEKIRVSWHGGEPLLAGKDFFNQIIRLEKKYSKKEWLNSVQTNATLIDHEWAEFFSTNKFSVGVSVDGSERTHNGARLNAIKQGTYSKVIQGVKILRCHNIYPGIICTVTKKTFKYADEMLHGLLDAGFKGIAFNAFYNTASEGKRDVYGLTDEEWLCFLKKIFETWLTLNNPEIKIRELDGALAWVKSKAANYCMYKGTCYQWFVIDYEGKIYPCERLGKAVTFGSINSLKTFDELINQSVFVEWKKSIERMPQKCQDCKLKMLCHNGCVSHRQANNEGAPLYSYCESRLKFYDYINDRINGRR